MPQIAAKLAFEEPTAGAAPFADFVLGAKLELYACLQLLAERARFVTGASWAAIALLEGFQFLYRAATGRGSPEIGTEVELKLEDCNQSQPILQSDKKSIAVLVFHDSHVGAVIRLFSNGLEFGEHDIQSVVRMAEMVSTAIDHMEAADRSHALILAQSEYEHSEELSLALEGAEQSPELIVEPPQELISLEVKSPAKQPGPLLWHAPEGVAGPSLPTSSGRNPAVAANVRLCGSCGFPVSHGRNICFDCEERGRVPAAPALFNSQKPASWISTHGYTIASLLLPALAAALIYWLRLR
jgi:hypothetical protein